VSALAVAVLLGATLAAGISLVVSASPRWGAPSLVRRIAPHVRDLADPLGLTPLARLGDLDVRRLLRAAQLRVARAMGGSVSVARRLRRADRPVDVVGFRARQLVWTVSGAAIGGVLAVALALAGAASSATALLPAVGGVAGIVSADALLTRAANARVARMAEELPHVLEFLALCLAAGEGLRDTVRRVSDAAGGDLTDELRRVSLAVSTGSGLAEALSASAARLDLPAWSRAVDHLVAAIERGAPLAAVLQTQAEDARETARRRLLESAGRKEILMLVPLVFLILPLSVLFAVYPGVLMLRLGVG